MVSCSPLIFCRTPFSSGFTFSPRFTCLLRQLDSMNRMSVLAILLIAAIFEAGGDALVRAGLRQGTSGWRWLAFLGGAVVLFTYGLIVNAPDWEFGRLLGIYVVFFFLIAQLLSWVLFHQPPSIATMIGGALIVAGGVVLAEARA